MRQRFSEEQIIDILKQNEAGIPAAQICHEHGIGESTFYKWKAKFGEMSVSEVKLSESPKVTKRPIRKVLRIGLLDIPIWK